MPETPPLLGVLNSQALADVKTRIAAARDRSPNAAEQVTLVAVTKAFPLETLISAYEGGLRVFGESRVQEAAVKLPRFPQRSECEVRLIGHLQSNKAKTAVDLFDLIESVDTLKILRRVDRLASEAGKRPSGHRPGPGRTRPRHSAFSEPLEEPRAGQRAKLPVYLQVNAGHDEAKFGFDPDELLKLILELADVQCLRIAGVMTIAPLTDDEARLRDCFCATRQVRDALRFQIPTCTDLSMGMTDDFELAVEEGATHVRIGRALFGERP